MQTIIGWEFPEKVIPLINEAKSKIRIVVFDWRWYPNDPGSSCQLFNQSLVRAVRRGVDIGAITNFEGIAKTLEALGIKAKKIRVADIVHCKFIIIDDYFVVIGSHNFTQNAFTKNFEASVIFEDTEAAKKLLEFFEKLWLL